MLSCDIPRVHVCFAASTRSSWPTAFWSRWSPPSRAWWQRRRGIRTTSPPRACPPSSSTSWNSQVTPHTHTRTFLPRPLHPTPHNELQTTLRQVCQSWFCIEHLVDCVCVFFLMDCCVLPAPPSSLPLTAPLCPQSWDLNVVRSSLF